MSWSLIVSTRWPPVVLHLRLMSIVALLHGKFKKKFGIWEHQKGTERPNHVTVLWVRQKDFQIPLYRPLFLFLIPRSRHFIWLEDLGLMIRYVSSDSGHVWRNLFGYRSVCIHYLKPGTAIRSKGYIFTSLRFFFCRTIYEFTVYEGTWIVTKFTFPLRISHHNPMKTRNPTPAGNWDSRFPPQS